MADSDADAHVDPVEQAFAVSCSLLHALVEELARAPGRPREDITRVLFGFPRAAALFDDREPLFNADWTALFGDVFPPPIADALTALAVSGTEQRVHELEVKLAGYIAHFDVVVRPVGPRHGALVICADVTERAIANQLRVGDRTLLWCGTTAERPGFYNRQWWRTIGTDWRRAVHDSDAERWIAVATDAGSRRESQQLELRLLGTNGTSRWYRVRFARGRGQLIGCADDVDGELRHRNERKELVARVRAARAEAEEANRLKDEFLAVVSHELRAPLTTMLLWEKVLRENGTDEESRNRALDAIHHSTTTQARLVADLLDVARGVSGKLYLDIRAVDITDLVTEAFEAVRPAAEAKAIELAGKFGLFIGGIHGDATRLRQVLDNLLSNAVKFTPPGGHIAVSLVRRGRSVAVDIEDSGRGIAPEYLTRIFEPFRQIDDVVTRGEGGLGLGLTISKQLVDLHRGTLTATSAGIGKGARFTLTLPAAGTPRAPSPPVGARRPPRLDGARVLLIDDDARVRDALAALLGRVGVVVELADSAAMGRARLAATDPDAVICDIAMPGEDGYSFVRDLRATGYSTPSIALTGYATQADARRAVEAGFDIHLAKPISAERLVDSLSELLARRTRTNT